MNLNFKPNFGFNIGKKNKGDSKNLFFGIAVLFYRLRRSVKLMTRFESILATFFIVLFLVLLGIKMNINYTGETKLVPAYGGEYKEAVLGELKYINPIVAASDIDRSVSKLIYSGLVKIDKDGNPVPDLAESWTVSTNNLEYTFKLKEKIFFHDDTPLTANNVSDTINQIKDPDLKSPLYERWKDVEVTVVDDKTVTFILPKVFGSFLTLCDFGILPEFQGSNDNDKYIGTGPYIHKKTEQEIQTIGTKINSINLEANKKYYNEAPFIKNIYLQFHQDRSEVLNVYLEKKFNAVSGLNINEEEIKNESADLSFPTKKTLALIVNLRNERFKDPAARKKIFKAEEKFESRENISLTTLDSEVQRSQAEDLKKKFDEKNIALNIKYLNPVDLQVSLDKKDYELLLYGFDFSVDRDLYDFWHSTQVNRNNFSGYSNKDVDILIEDGRMSTDTNIRNQKFEQALEMIKNENIVTLFDPIKYNFYVKDKIKGINRDDVISPASRYEYIVKWYIKEMRVKK